jgi:hypothetical protein
MESSKKITKFKSGAVRDSQENKEDYIESISWLTMRRYAQYMTKMASKYGRGNWIKGIPKENYEQSLLRHIQKYISAKYYGVDVEPNYDHLSAALFNLQGLIHEEEVDKAKKSC